MVKSAIEQILKSASISDFRVLFPFALPKYQLSQQINVQNHSFQMHMFFLLDIGEQAFMVLDAHVRTR